MQNDFQKNWVKKFNLNKTAIKLVEEEGIVFIDEIDKISTSKDVTSR